MTDATSMLPLCRWFTQWCQYSGFSYDPSNPRRKPRVMAQDQPGPRPGPIDSSDLLAQPPVRSLQQHSPGYCSCGTMLL